MSLTDSSSKGVSLLSDVHPYRDSASAEKREPGSAESNQLYFSFGNAEHRKFLESPDSVMQEPGA